MDAEDHGRRLSAAIGPDRARRDTVASLVRVPRRTVAKWMRGEAMPTAEEYAALQYYLGDYDTRRPE